MDSLAIAGLIIGAVGVIVSVLAWVWPDPINSRRKPVSRLEYVTVRNNALLHVLNGVSVKVSIEGRSVEQAYVTVIRVVNTGTVSFRSMDWEAPMTVSLPGSSVISARQVAARPDRFRVPSPKIIGDKIELAPFLINPGDLFDLQIVTEGGTPSPHLDVRIPGLDQARRRRGPVYAPGNGVDGTLETGNKVFTLIFGLLLLGLAALALFGPMVSESGAATTLQNRLPLAGFAMGAFGAYAVFLRWSIRRSRRWRPAERF